ncbi:MAG TPA: hypothetical protein VHI52_06375, partial [Verrucomicrobiae bacterium]|nr:hypothetical protein [Verrucomicrobiae bacterium]
MASKTILPLLPLLHIDDDANDRLLIQEAIASTNTRFEYHGVEDLDSAVKFFGFLPHINPSLDHPRPSLVLLDYDLGAR